MRYDSGHSKLVKRGVAFSAMIQSVRKSCAHKAEHSLRIQVERLRASRYPDVLLAVVAEKALKSVLKKDRAMESDQLKKKTRPVVLPYIHEVAHGLKKIAGKHELPVVFTALKKLIGLCEKVNNEQKPRGACSTKHEKKYVECKKDVVYQLPLPCGKCYIGQPGRCVNTRLREHYYNCQQITHPGKLADHCHRCPRCSSVPDYTKTGIIGRASKKIEREIF